MSSTAFEPLASILRPRSFKDYVGQTHLVGDQAPIRKMVEQGQCYSMLLWGPPGIGKTSLVEVLKHELDAQLIYLSAINSGVKDIRAAVDAPDDLLSQRKIVFVDEIHRFNKAQQDAFLPFVESGKIILIGATTENPSFSINRALLSRMRVFILNALSDQELGDLLEKATQHLEQQKSVQISFEEGVKASFISHSEGDARRLLLSLEIASDSASDNVITRKIAAMSMGVKTLNYDKNGDAHYDLLSAFHKSVRGSSPDGALYWFVRLLESGGDIQAISRRLLAIASEDIGNADPKALQVCLNAWDIYNRVGAAEGERAIAQAVIYCALAPKSNAVYNAFKAAKRDVENNAAFAVPNHLRNAPTALAKEMNHGKNYRYAHNETHAYAAGEQYLPEELSQTKYYQPSERGFEKTLSQKMAFLRQLDEQHQQK
ncbi:replication-associated recombination protein A [Glaciecola sp. KUL10]|uniref:replication-associated recombination protein A n=1 Tax=Glaciecola sp. (strain KUL10) TaxID=2161813 RepID=UPI000D7848C5|nr:replication-associated recombination protein A [Glaciecola sp. KUL10]GBL02975.1 recombination factor protein RarA [Glaciecola sp. KUL10]